jgi:alpha-glutamyl/putrescinyl thymine pyrophosphorylase clade 1
MMPDLTLSPEALDRFLYYVRERQAIYERRAAGAPSPWTDDDILRRTKFCCVLRDDDRTSREARRIILDLPAD